MYMEELKALTNKVQELLITIDKLKKERDNYEKKCFELIEDINKKNKMLSQIEKIIFK